MSSLPTLYYDTVYGTVGRIKLFIVNIYYTVMQIFKKYILLKITSSNEVEEIFMKTNQKWLEGNFEIQVHSINQPGR